MTKLTLMTISKRVRIVLALILAFSSITYFMPKAVLAVDGDLDATFGTGGSTVPLGVARISYGANSCSDNDSPMALGIQSTGKIIAAGVTQPPGDFALARLNTNGALDTSFGTMGKVQTNITATDNLNDIAIDSDDTIVAVGSVLGAGSCVVFDADFAIVKYKADGSGLDTSFNGTGKVTKDIFACLDSLTAVVIQSDHKIVVAGFADKPIPMTANFTTFVVLARLNANGTFDSTFNGGDGTNMSGIVMFDQNMSGLGIPSDMTLIPSGPQAGKFITVGSLNDMQVARFNTNGSLDTAFGTSSGKTNINFGAGVSSNARSVALQSDGKIIAGGDANSGSKFAMARVDSAGTLDSAGFGTGGKVTTIFPAPAVNGSAKFVGVMSNSNIILSGSVQGSDMTNDLGIARYNANGALDTTFGTMGTVFTHLGQNPNGVCGGMATMPVNNAVLPQTGALQSDGKILVAGSINTSTFSDSDFFVARFQNSGLDCTLTCPANKIQSNNPNQCGAVVTYSSPTETGTQCGGKINCSPTSGSFFPLGTTTVICTDSAGPSCSFTVTVNDTQSPTITCPSNMTALGAPCKVVTYTTPTPSDNCPGATASCSPPSGTCFPVGTTTVTCTAKDASNNMATCTFTITVSDCTITCPTNQTVFTGPGATQCCAVANFSPTTTGSCGTVTCAPTSGSCFPVGATTVTCTTTAGPSCSFTVTVMDNTPPVITCPANVTAVTDQNACPSPACQTANFPAPVASDNCPGVGVVCNPASGSCFAVGVNTVTCTATDMSGNTASCSFTVTTFDTALQDDSNPSTILLWNSISGQYRFCCNGITITGVGKATRQGCVYTLDHTNAADRRVLGRADKAVHAGSGSIQAPPGTTRCTITDRDTRNDTLLPACQ